MLSGSVQAVLSYSREEASRAAEILGKKHESDWIPIYYRREDDFLRSVLVPPSERFLEASLSATIADAIYVVIGEVPTRQDAEMALLAEASGAASQLVVKDPSFFAELSVSRGWTRVLSPILGKPRELGYVYVDRLFPVKGVGPVALGFTFASISVHQELRAIPSGKQLQVRSIQVLDEDQEEVGLGIRVGLALKGAQMEELQGTYALEVTEGSISVMSAHFSDAKVFRWAKTLPSRFHVLAGGLKTLGELRQDADQLSFASPLPKGARALLLDLDAGPKSSRVIGYLDLTHGGRNIPLHAKGTRFASRIAI